jgi:hypothetical protein
MAGCAQAAGTSRSSRPRVRGGARGGELAQAGGVAFRQRSGAAIVGCTFAVAVVLEQAASSMHSSWPRARARAPGRGAGGDRATTSVAAAFGRCPSARRSRFREAGRGLLGAVRGTMDSRARTTNWLYSGPCTRPVTASGPGTGEVAFEVSRIRQLRPMQFGACYRQ